jgi:hypothetical protein
VSTDLCELFSSLVLPLDRPTGQSLSAIAIPGAEGHRLGKDAGGSPCLLLRQSTSAAATSPIRLQNLMVSYAVPCVIVHPNGLQEEGVFTIVRCSNSDPALFPHFLRIVSPILATLGATPSAAAVRRAITGLVDLFQALTAPARKSIQGLWAELLIIKNAADPVALASAWHGVPTERIDFVRGRERLEIKSCSSRQRVHYFSQEQLTPPAGAQIVVASLFVEPVGGGLSLRALSDDIRGLLASDSALLTRFDSVFYATLGAAWSDAMEERFDLELATDSLCFFDSADIPKSSGRFRRPSAMYGLLPIFRNPLLSRPVPCGRLADFSRPQCLRADGDTSQTASRSGTETTAQE